MLLLKLFWGAMIHMHMRWLTQWVNVVYVISAQPTNHFPISLSLSSGFAIPRDRNIKIRQINNTTVAFKYLSESEVLSLQIKSWK